MAENQNFIVTVNDASETVTIEDDKPVEAVAKPDKKADNAKGGVNNAPAIP